MIDNSRSDKILRHVVNIAMLFVIVIMFYPFWNVLVLSIVSPEEAAKAGLHLFPSSFDISAYRLVLSSPEIGQAAINSVLRVLIGTSLSVVGTMLTAYPLSKRDKLPGYRFWMTYVIITMYFSGGLIPTYVMYKSLGLVDNFLVLVLPGLISGYNLIIVRNFIRSIPESLEESCKLDGASDFAVWLRIILPISLPVMAVITLWSAVGHWNAYFDVLIYITDRKKYVLPIILRRVLIDGQGNQFMNMQQAALESDKAMPLETQTKSALIMVCSIPIMLIYPFAQKYFIQGIVVGAVKG